jgi:hypothetical protein
MEDLPTAGGERASSAAALFSALVTSMISSTTMGVFPTFVAANWKGHWLWSDFALVGVMDFKRL